MPGLFSDIRMTWSHSRRALSESEAKEIISSKIFPQTAVASCQPLANSCTQSSEYFLFIYSWVRDLKRNQPQRRRNGSFFTGRQKGPLASEREFQQFIWFHTFEGKIWHSSWMHYVVRIRDGVCSWCKWFISVSPYIVLCKWSLRDTSFFKSVSTCKHTVFRAFFI